MLVFNIFVFICIFSCVNYLEDTERDQQMANYYVKDGKKKNITISFLSEQSALLVPWDLIKQKQTDLDTDIATYRLNRPRGRLKEKLTG